MDAVFHDASVTEVSSSKFYMPLSDEDVKKLIYPLAIWYEDRQPPFISLSKFPPDLLLYADGLTSNERIRWWITYSDSSSQLPSPSKRIRPSRMADPFDLMHRWRRVEDYAQTKRDNVDKLTAEVGRLYPGMRTVSMLHDQYNKYQGEKRPREVVVELNRDPPWAWSAWHQTRSGLSELEQLAEVKAYEHQELAAKLDTAIQAKERWEKKAETMKLLFELSLFRYLPKRWKENQREQKQFSDLVKIDLANEATVYFSCARKLGGWQIVGIMAPWSRDRYHHVTIGEEK